MAFDLSNTTVHPRYGELNASAKKFVCAIDMNDSYKISNKKMQIQIKTADGHPIGGINPVQKHLYILQTFSEGKISDERLIGLGFRLKQRSDGSFFWMKPGADDILSLQIAIEEMNGVFI